MLIDSHCHLDASAFDADRGEVLARSRVNGIVIPAVAPANFSTVIALAHRLDEASGQGARGPELGYALGIHPLYVPGARDEDLDLLDQTLADHLHDPRLLAVGEIGLDFFVPELTVSPLREKQERFYRAQLRLARKYQLPVILHVRRALDQVLKGLRQLPVRSGIAHAFNGSEQQALAFQSLGFCLGFGGAMTYSRALQIRRLAVALEGTAIVLETDAPDIAPEWLHGNSRLPDPDRPLGVHARNSPEQLPRIAACLAQLREQSYEQVCAATSANVMRVLPRFQALFKGPAH